MPRVFTELFLARIVCAAAALFAYALLVNVEAAERSDSKVVELASLEWPPYISEESGENSYVYQLTKQAFQASGYELKVGFYPWARALYVAKTGAMSGMFPEYYSADREDDFLFSDPFPCGPITLFKRQGGEPEFTTSPLEDEEQALRELSKYRFGVVRGYVNTEALDSADFLNREQARSDELNLRKLQFGRVDLAAVDPYVARHLLSTTLSAVDGELEAMSPPLQKKSLHIAFSKRDENSEELRKAFNSGLKQLRESGQLRALLNAYGFQELAAELSADPKPAE